VLVLTPMMLRPTLSYAEGAREGGILPGCHDRGNRTQQHRPSHARSL